MPSSPPAGNIIGTSCRYKGVQSTSVMLCELGILLDFFVPVVSCPLRCHTAVVMQGYVCVCVLYTSLCIPVPPFFGCDVACIVLDTSHILFSLRPAAARKLTAASPKRTPKTPSPKRMDELAQKNSQVRVGLFPCLPFRTIYDTFG